MNTLIVTRPPTHPWTVLRVFFRLGLPSFGGPVAHLGYFRDEFVTRRRRLNDRSYADLVALCQFLPDPFGGIVLIFVAITFIRTLLRELMVGRAKEILHSAIGRGPIAGITAGTPMTVLVQSSSTTTSLMVPLAGTGVFRRAQIYPFTLGANMGTCIAALLAATAVTGAEAMPALQIVMVHLLYNFLGVVVIYGIPFLAHLPIVGAETLAEVASEHKFFLIPGLLLGITSMT